MGITAAIGSAFSGLRAAQAGMDVVSSNVANAGTVGYTRRVLSTTQQISGDRTTGVTVVGAQRTLDRLLQRQLRLENAGASYTGVKADMTASLEASFDPAGGTGSITSLVNGFGSSLQALATNPGSYTARSAVVGAASTLAGQLNSLAGDIQALRQDAESGLSRAVGEVNDLLKQLEKANALVVTDPQSGGSAAAQDMRDGIVDKLSSFLDLNVTTASNGAVTVTTTGGLQLFDGAHPVSLSFDAHSPISARSAYDIDPAKRSVGTITATNAAGGTTDVIASGMIRSGSIAGYLEMRDEVLPQAQAQLDGLAAGLSSALSDRTVTGTAAASGGATGFDIDLAGLGNGNSFTLAVSGPGGDRSVTFVKTGSAAAAAAATSADGRTVGIDFSGGLSAVATRVAAALGGGFSASNPSGSTLRVLDDGAAGTTDVRSATGRATATTTLSGSGELPLFVDGGGPSRYTGSFEGGAQLTGFAGRIALNPDVLADNGTLVAYGSSTPAGDATRPNFIFGQLTGATVTFPGSTGVGGATGPFGGTVAGYAEALIAGHASAANAAKNLHEGQSVALNAVQSRYADTAGVNIDTEMTQLIQLQTAYGANARVMNAAKQMLDTLMAVGA